MFLLEKSTQIMWPVILVLKYQMLSEKSNKFSEKNYIS